MPNRMRDFACFCPDIIMFWPNSLRRTALFCKHVGASASASFTVTHSAIWIATGFSQPANCGGVRA